MLIYECPYCKNQMEKLEDVCPNCGAQNGEFRRMVYPDINPQKETSDDRNLAQGNLNFVGNRNQMTKADQYAIMSLVFGVVSLVMDCLGMGIIAGIPGIVFGVMGRKADRKACAIIGIVISISGTLFSAIIWILAIMEILAEMPYIL